MEKGRTSRCSGRPSTSNMAWIPGASVAPDRILGVPPQTRGANKDRTVDVDTMMEDYWELFGWDRHTGKPTKRASARWPPLSEPGNLTCQALKIRP